MIKDGIIFLNGKNLHCGEFEFGIGALDNELLNFKKQFTQGILNENGVYIYFKHDADTETKYRLMLRTNPASSYDTNIIFQFEYDGKLYSVTYETKLLPYTIMTFNRQTIIDKRYENRMSIMKDEYEKYNNLDFYKELKKFGALNLTENKNNGLSLTDITIIHPKEIYGNIISEDYETMTVKLNRTAMDLYFSNNIIDTDSYTICMNALCTNHNDGIYYTAKDIRCLSYYLRRNYTYENNTKENL